MATGWAVRWHTPWVPESFAEFKDSFSYGSRSDLAFKFLKSLDDEEAGEFFRELLSRLGETIDDGEADRLVQLAYEWQVRGYGRSAEKPSTWTYDDSPFAPMRRVASEATIALVTSSGHFVDDPEPFGVQNMTQAEAESRIQEFLREAPELSEVPFGSRPDEVSVRHGGYDTRGAVIDRNVGFPIDRLVELASRGVIGELHDPAYSFVGAAAQRRIKKEQGPKWAEMLNAAEVHAAILVPL